jgi:hypothetical protein
MEERYYTVTLTHRQYIAVSSIGRSLYLQGTDLDIGEVIDLEDRLRMATIESSDE